MNNNKLLLVILFALITCSSCRKLADINTNPNSPTIADPQLLLPKILVVMGRDINSTSSMYATKMLVQSDGESNEQFYKWDRGGFDGYNNLRDITKMMEEAERVNNKSYVAVGKFLRAYYFLNLTLTFGDIPYSEALMGESGAYKPPVYDQQKDVFKGILKELSEANELLKTHPGAMRGDIIYNGDPAKWRKLVNSFRLLVLMTLSKKETDSELNIKQTFASIAGTEPLMADFSDNAHLTWLDQQDNRYPEFNSSGFGSGMYMDSTFIKRLQDRRDPRLYIFSTQTKNGKEAGKSIIDFTSYEGGDPAAPYATINVKATRGDISKVNERYYKDPTAEPAAFFTYAELQLVLAEAVVRDWIAGDAAAYYNKGIGASFAFYNKYAKGYGNYVNEAALSDYLSGPLVNFANANSKEEKIEKIIMQKYFQSYLQRMWYPYYEALRTGYPSFRRPEGVSLPYRFMYPVSEVNTNKANLSVAINRQFGEGNDKITEKPWWLK